MTHQEEKKNQRIAMFTSIGVHAAVFLLLFFLIAWKQPNPPHPEIGIEVNWGEDDRGSGNRTPDKTAGSQGNAQKEPNQPTPVEEDPEPEPKTETAVKTPPVQQEVVTQTESPVVVEKKKEEVKQPDKPVEKVEPKKEPEKPKVNDAAVYKPRAQNESDNKTSEAKTGQNANEGNDANASGNKGQDDGTLNPDAVYKGKAGGGDNGMGLSMPGWRWASQPQPKGLSSTLSGKIKFEIEVDENGDVVKITTLERTLNFEDERMLRSLIQRSQLEKTSAGDAPPRSKGIVEFNLRLE